MKEKLRLLPLILLAVCLTLALALTSCDTGSSGTGDDTGSEQPDGGSTKPPKDPEEVIPPALEIKSQLELDNAIKDSSVKNILVLVDELQVRAADDKGSNNCELNFKSRDPDAKLNIELRGDSSTFKGTTSYPRLIVREIPEGVSLKVTHGLEAAFADSLAKMYSDFVKIKGTLILGDWYGTGSGITPIPSLPTIEGELVLGHHAVVAITTGDLTVADGGAIRLPGDYSSLLVTGSSSTGSKLVVLGNSSEVELSGASSILSLTGTATGNTTRAAVLESSIRGKLTLSGGNSSVNLNAVRLIIESGAVLAASGTGASVNVQTVALPIGVSNYPAELVVNSGGTAAIGNQGTLTIGRSGLSGSRLTVNANGAITIAAGGTLVLPVSTTDMLLNGIIDLKGNITDYPMGIWAATGDRALSSGKIVIYSSTKFINTVPPEVRSMGAQFESFLITGDATIDWYYQNPSLSTTFVPAANQMRVFEFKKNSGSIRGSERQRIYTSQYSSDMGSILGTLEDTLLDVAEGTGFWQTGAIPYDETLSAREFLFSNTAWYKPAVVSYNNDEDDPDETHTLFYSNIPPKGPSSTTGTDFYAFPDGKYNARFGYLQKQ